MQETLTMDLHNIQAKLIPSCPYTLKLLFSNRYASTFLIREKDRFDEFPNIYAKVYTQHETHQPLAVILSDSGTGLDVGNDQSGSIADDINDETVQAARPTRWNIATFLSSTINPNHSAPYIVLTTHCHYDHIGGIRYLKEASPTMVILASSHNIGYLTPWSNLQKHSLCELKGLKAPHYDARWIEDNQTVTYAELDSASRKDSSITVIHTPGHTPDSISWYDRDSCTLCVGDMFYEKESDETRSGSGGHWAREPPQPVVFMCDSNIVDWNASMHRLLDFVRSENRRLGTSDIDGSATKGYRQTGHGVPLSYTEILHEDWSVVHSIPARRRVVLCAAHVTVAADAEFALLDMLAFMLRIQLDQVPKKRVNDVEGSKDIWLWDDSLPSASQQQIDDTSQVYRFSVKAPWTIIHRDSHQDSSHKYTSIEQSRNTDFRSMLRQMTTPGSKLSDTAHLKSNALSSVSHNSVMADLPASSTRSSARKG